MTIYDEHNSGRKPDYFIAAERSSNALKRQNTRPQPSPPPRKNVPSLSIPAAALDKLLGKFFKGVDKQNDSISNSYSSYLSLNRLVSLPIKALKSSFSSRASPRLSFIASTNIDSISTRL